MNENAIEERLIEQQNLIFRLDEHYRKTTLDLQNQIEDLETQLNDLIQQTSNQTKQQTKSFTKSNRKATTGPGTYTSPNKKVIKTKPIY